MSVMRSITWTLVDGSNLTELSQYFRNSSLVSESPEEKNISACSSMSKGKSQVEAPKNMDSLLKYLYRRAIDVRSSEMLIPGMVYPAWSIFWSKMSFLTSKLKILFSHIRAHTSRHLKRPSGAYYSTRPNRPNYALKSSNIRAGSRWFTP
jgi:hypothetical protein